MSIKGSSIIPSIELVIMDGELIIIRKLNGIAVETDTPDKWARQRTLDSTLKEHLEADWDYMHGHSDD